MVAQFSRRKFGLLASATTIAVTGAPLFGASAEAQTNPMSPANADPDRLRAIVQAEAQKTGTKAVVFGMWLRDREVLTSALGNSMTAVPASTEMHYRIGGIAETFMSTLLLMLVEQGRISLDDKISRWFPRLL